MSTKLDPNLVGPLPRYFRRAGVLAALLLAGASVAVPAAAEQDPRAQQELQLGVAALEAGDTAAGLAHLERAVALDRRFAEAHFWIGRTLARRSAERSDTGDYERGAFSALEAAVRFDAGNPKYLLEYGLLQLRQRRITARRVLQQALDNAGRADAETYAEIRFQLALLEETQWLRFRDRHNPVDRIELDSSGLAQVFSGVSGQLTLDDARFAWDVTEPEFHAGTDQGLLRREAMLEHLRAALAAHPAHVGAATHLLAYYYDENLRHEYLDFARQFVRAAPAEPMAYLCLGLGLTWTGSDEEAAGAFELGLALAPPALRREFENVGRLLGRERERDFLALSGEERAEAARGFWLRNNPLYLTAPNEYWLEFMSRMTYADMRYGLPEYNVRGWETDRGLIHVRYGPPARSATYSVDPGPTRLDLILAEQALERNRILYGPDRIPLVIVDRGRVVLVHFDDDGLPTLAEMDSPLLGNIVTLWAYGPAGPAFLFTQSPGYRRAIFGPEYRWYADELRAILPNRLVAPSIPERYPVPVQTARFRGAEQDMAVEVHALLPLDLLSRGVDLQSGELEIGLFVRDTVASELVRRVRREVVEFQSATARIESWRLGLPAVDEFLVSVEAREPLSARSAVGRVAIEPRSFETGGLTVSDILLAHLVEPIHPDPTSRDDYRIVPNPTMRYGLDQPVAMYFEIYGLKPDDEGYVEFELDLTVTLTDLDRSDRMLIARLIGELADKWGATPVGADAAQIRYYRQARVLARDVVPEYFAVTLPDPPAGNYEVRVKVKDVIGAGESITERSFGIVRERSPR